jgi:hypothetical protein
MIPTTSGWKTYIIDLNSVPLSNSAGTDPRPWNQGPITGLGIYPSVTPQNVSIDYVRLEDPASCGTTPLNVSASPSGDNNRFSLFLDSDTDPFNGVYQLISSSLSASGPYQTTLSAKGLTPGVYRVLAVLDSDYSTLTFGNPWNFDNETDVVVAGNISNGKFEGGTFSGTTSSQDANIFLVTENLPVDGTTYSKLSLRITRNNENEPVRILWNGGFKDLRTTSPEYKGNGIYHVDLANESGWSGSEPTLIIRPSILSGITFSLDWVRLRQVGFVSSEAISVTSGQNTVRVLAPPLLKIIQPDIKGGEALIPLNFRPGDVQFSLNLKTDIDPSHPKEALTTYLPDVREVGGRRGDFFKGTNIAGNDDPNDFITFRVNSPKPFTIDASEYRNACLMMMLDRDYDLGLGSVTKYFYQKTSGDVEEFDAFATIFDRWKDNRWYEYCADLSTFPREDGQVTWGGILDGFRIDPHEFHEAICCDNTGNPFGPPISATYYYDYLKLRKDDESRGKFTLVYHISDTDTPNPTIRWFYSTVKGATSGGNEIPTSKLTCEGKICVWDTTGITPGTYYVYATASDGASTSLASASGRLKIVNSGSTQTPPIISIASPTSLNTYCNTMQFKGYSLMPNRFEDVASIQVFIDGQYFTSLDGTKYSPSAVTTYPNADSSNTGFDEVHSLADIANGSHSLEIVAHSMDGGRASSGAISFTKGQNCSGGNSGGPPLVIDAAPSGSPVAANVISSQPNDNNNNGGKNDDKAPTISTIQNKRGTVTMTIRNIGSDKSECSVSVYAGETAGTVNSFLKRFKISKRNLRSRKLVLTATKINISAKQIPNLYFITTRTCDAYKNVTSSVTKMRILTRKGIKKYNVVVRALKRLKAPK